MARRQRSFKRNTNKNYGWACAADVLTIIDTNAIDDTVLVAGDADIEIRAVGGTHANLKRIVGDLVWFPYNLATQTSLDNPASTTGALYWAIVLSDNDDSTPIDPSSATALCEESILAHGILPWMIQKFANQPAVNNNTSHFFGEMKQHIDVKSNRRIKGDNDVKLWTVIRGSNVVSSQDTQLRYSLRCLLSFP